jgi:uncharacterized membrane protein YtjA (UPF0391 family)
MFRLAVLFLCMAFLAGLMGFGGLATYSWEVAKVLCYVLLALAAMAFAGGWFIRPTHA